MTEGEKVISIQDRLATIPEKDRSWTETGFNRRSIKEEDLINKPFLSKLHSLWFVAVHEIGHKIVGRRFGLGVAFISIVARGNILGFTRFIFDASKSRLQNLMNFGRAAFGGEEALRAVGHNHPEGGASSDHNHAEYTARIINFPNPESIISQQRSDAQNAISDAGITYIEDQGWGLFDRKEAA